MHCLQFCYGFIADPTKSNKHNLYVNLLSSSLLTLASCTTNSTCHNLCTYLTLPRFFQSLLGLSLKFSPCPCSLHPWVANFLTTLQPHYSKGHRTPSNLTPPQHAVLNTLLTDHHYIVFLVDKNLGLCILERGEYIQWVLTEHLSNMNTYHHLPFHKACDILESTDSLITEFIMDYCQFISPSDC